MEEARKEKPTLSERVIRWFRPTRVYLTHDGPSFIASQIVHQFEDELETRRYKAIQA